MKTLPFIRILILTTLCIPAWSVPAPADRKATKETVKLFNYLYELKSKGIMFGHQDDLMYGYNWWYEPGKSDTRAAVGDYPTVAGFELGHIELGDSRSLDSVNFDQIREQVKEHYMRGGIVTISWHLNNPLTMQNNDPSLKWPHGTAWDVSSNEVVSSILPGGKNNELFNTWLERLATFLSSLRDDKGTPIPFIFRPFHEHSGSFFWWGTNICTDSEYSALWRYTVTYLRDRKNIHNILYAYNTDRVTSLEQYLKGYPGDDIIDMLSLDMYDRGESFGSELDNALQFIIKEAASRQKLAALSETGERKGLKDWWMNVLLPVVSKYPLDYVLTWRDAFKSKVTVGGNPVDAYKEDFLEFYKSPRTLFLKDIKDYKIYGTK